MTISPEQLQAWKRLADEAKNSVTVEDTKTVSYNMESMDVLIEAVPALIAAYEELLRKAESFKAQRKLDLQNEKYLKDEVERLQSDLEFSNDVIKERESWAAMRLQTCKKLENEIDRLRKQLDECKKQRDIALSNTYNEVNCMQVSAELDAEIEAIK